MSCNSRFFLCCITLLCLLSACGGSDDDSTSSGLFVNAGADRTVAEQTTVTLSGESQTDATSVTYTWTVSPLLTITHADTASAEASFVAPTVTQQTAYTFTLSASDSDGNSASDSVVITVQPVNAEPLADIQIAQWPNLEVGQYPAGVSLTLDGRGSVDPDNSAANAIIAYQWQQLAGTDVLNDVDTTLSQLTFTSPIAQQAQTMRFQLTVTDTEQAQGVQSISFSIQSASETLPVVNAGVDHSVFSGESIILDGTATTSVPSASPVTVLWQNDSGIEVLIDDPNAAQTFAIAPLVEAETEIALTLSGTDNNGNQVHDRVLVTVRQMPLIALNDTGVMVQGTADVNISEHSNEFPGQDAQRGQDRIAFNGLSEKAGRGDRGFDFTRLNQNGDEVDDPTQDWRCIRDNITGLVWEIKTDTADIHDAEHSYSWYQATNNGGFEGDENGAETQCPLDNCNTSEYVNFVNNAGLCGFYDWRIPKHDELLSIVHFGQSDGTAIDVDYFPFTDPTSSGTSPLWYWTIQPNADGVQGDTARNAWAIDFTSGVDNFINKSSAARIRLVRAGRP